MAAAAAVAVMIIMRMKRREGGPQKVLQPKDFLERTPHTRAHTRSAGQRAPNAPWDLRRPVSSKRWLLSLLTSVQTRLRGIFLSLLSCNNSITDQ